MTCYEKNVNESSTIMRQDWFLFIADFGSGDITWLKSEVRRRRTSALLFSPAEVEAEGDGVVLVVDGQHVAVGDLET